MAKTTRPRERVERTILQIHLKLTEEDRALAGLIRAQAAINYRTFNNQAKYLLTLGAETLQQREETK